MSVARRNLIDGGYVVFLLALAIGNGYLLLPSTAHTREVATVSIVIPVPGSAVSAPPSPPPPITTVARSSAPARAIASVPRSEEHTSELQSLAYLVCRLLLEKKKKIYVRCNSDYVRRER